MFRRNELKAEMVRRGMTNEKLAAAIGLSPATLHRKMFEHTDFYRNEIVKIAEALQLSDDDIRRIFFAPDLA